MVIICEVLRVLHLARVHGPTLARSRALFMPPRSPPAFPDFVNSHLIILDKLIDVAHRELG